MKIEIDTQNMSEIDKDVLRIVLGIKQQTEPVQRAMDCNMKTSDRMIILLDKQGSMTVSDMAQRLKRSEASLYMIISEFKKKGIIDKSQGRPARYFLRKKGDDELQEALKNSIGTKVSVMR